MVYKVIIMTVASTVLLLADFPHFHSLQLGQLGWEGILFSILFLV